MNISKDVHINKIDNTEALSIIKRKIRSCNLKVATIISKCEEFDKNNDNIIHSDDLEDILRDLLRDKMLSRRELRYLFEAIGGDKNGGNLVYNRLNDILDSNNHSKRDKIGSSRGDKEHWHTDNDNNQDSRWASTSGSVGEWLLKAACPNEVKNFKKFVACLEKFERETGMNVSLKQDGSGFNVPLGPDLSANIAFHMN